MNPNNPFGMEIDDDGLPKYSPDRKNIAAYHMYKLGLTDKLPDPEDTHTPFFRTPSYNAEKERQNRENANTFPQIDPPAFKQADYPKLAAANTGTKTDAGMPPLVTPDAPSSRKLTSSSPWESLFKTMGQAWLQLNPAATADDIRAAFGHDNTGTASQTPAPFVPKQPQAQTGAQTGSGTNPSGFNATPQTSQAASVNPDNPDCKPMKVKPVDWTIHPLLNNRRSVSPEMTNDINGELTRHYQCKPTGINAEAISMFEGGIPNDARVPWNEKSRHNKSGVTVGAGFDVGQNRDEKTLRNYGLPEAIVQKLKKYVKLQKKEAKTFLKNNPLNLTDEENDIINRLVIPRIGKDTINTWNNHVNRNRERYPNAPTFHELNSDQQTLLFSRYYNEGGNWIKNNPKIVDAILQNDWNKVTEEWQKSIDQFRENGTEWKANRFNDELKFYNRR